MANMKITRTLLISSGLDGFKTLTMFCSVTLQYTPEGQDYPMDLAKGYSKRMNVTAESFENGAIGEEEFFATTKQGQELYQSAISDLTRNVEEKAKQNLYQDAIDQFDLAVETANA